VGGQGANMSKSKMQDTSGHPEVRNDAVASPEIAWVRPHVEVIDIRETQGGGLGNNDGAASHS